jgi:hypothetical protein
MKIDVKVCSGSAIQINKLATLLEEKDIAYIIKNPHESGRLAGFGTSGQSVELYVSQDHVEDAEKIIASL